MEAENERPADSAPVQASPYAGPAGVVQGQDVAQGPGDWEPGEEV